MATKHTPEALDQVIAAIPPDLMEAIVGRHLSRKREERIEKKAKMPKQPETGRYKAIASGKYRRKTRPTAKPEDRQYVAGALRHWRRVHGLSYREAQARIGYSPRSCSWRHWEDGFVTPPYQTLLRIIAATGLGYWQDPRPQVAGELTLEATAAAWQSEIRRRRARRLARQRAE